VQIWTPGGALVVRPRVWLGRTIMVVMVVVMAQRRRRRRRRERREVRRESGS
jgi:hypothetical protein